MQAVDYEIRMAAREYEEEIQELQMKQELYENMRKKINNSIPQLQEAKRNIKKAKEEFEKAYSSKGTNEKDTQLEEDYQKVETIIGNLKDPILIGISDKVNSIKENIKTKNEKLQFIKENNKRLFP